MPFALLVALSHLRSRKHDAGVSMIALISIGGVIVGVTALNMVLAVMQGFEDDLRDKILGSNAHVVVLNANAHFEGWREVVEKVEQAPGVQAAAPFLYTEVMIRSDSGAAGVILKGIDPAHSGAVTDVVTNLKLGPEGPLLDLEEKKALIAQLSSPPEAISQDEGDQQKLPGIILGEELVGQLRVFVGDQVYLINPVGNGTGPMGVPVPRVQPFRVAGVFYSGMYEYDTKWTYVSMKDGQAFLQSGDVATGVEIRVDDPDAVEEISRDLEARLPFPWFVKHWQELNRSLFSALKLEKYVMGLILFLIVMVASLNIVGSLILVVVTRAREIAILRALGASSATVRWIFLLEGLIIGVVGTTFGTALGLAGCDALRRYRFPLDTDVYYLDTLPVVVDPANVVVVAIVAVLICFGATLYPASVAAGVQPVDGLRYE